MAYFMQQAALDGTYLPSGKKVSLDFILDETGDGYMATDNGYVVNQIRAAIASRSHGWVEITEADYNEAVKKKASSPPPRRGFRSLNAGMFQPNLGSVDAASAVVDKPDPIAVPTPEQLKLPPRPRVGRMVPT